MRPVFVDTQYWVARFHPEDQWHEQARDAEEARGFLKGMSTTVERKVDRI